MNKIIALSVVAVLAMSGSSYAADEKIVATSVAPAQDVLAARKDNLNNSEWIIELKPMASVKGKSKAEQDTLLFSDGKVSSANLVKAGYNTTNYTLRMLEDNETLTWETMQTSEKDGVSFWRGDIGPDGVMRGVLSKRDLKNNTKDFNFYSTGSKKVAPPAPPAPALVAPAPVVEPAAVEGK